MLQDRDIPRPTIEWFRQNPVISWSGVLAFVKDPAHKFVAVNAETAYLAGKNPLDMIGLGDADAPWVESARIHAGYENDILAGQRYSLIVPLSSPVKCSLFTTGSIIYDEAGLPAGVQVTVHLIEGGGIDRIQNSKRIVGSRHLNEFSGFGLTDAEARVLYFILRGHTRKGIAKILAIAPTTYDNHYQAIMKAFGAKNRDHLVRLCRNNYLHVIFPTMAFSGYDIHSACQSPGGPG